MEKSWGSVAISADGTKLIAAEYYAGHIYTSTDSGITWTERASAGVRNWHKVSSSADGTKLLATVGNYGRGYVYTSTDAGATWIQQTAPGIGSWTAATISPDGSHMYVGASGGNIYIGNVEGAATTTISLASRPTLNPVTLAPSSASVNTAVSNATVSVTSESCYTLNTSSVSRLTTEGVAAPAPNVSLLGGIAFSVDCVVNGGTSAVSVALDAKYSNTSLLRAYKTVGSGANMTLKDITDRVSITNVDVGGTMKTTVNYSLMDGSSLDEDGIVNGTIVDPIYIGLVATTASGTLASTGTNMWTIVWLASALLAVAAATVVLASKANLSRHSSTR